MAPSQPLTSWGLTLGPPAAWHQETTLGPLFGALCPLSLTQGFHTNLPLEMLSVEDGDHHLPAKQDCELWPFPGGLQSNQDPNQSAPQSFSLFLPRNRKATERCN